MQDKPQIIFLEDGYKIAIGDHESEDTDFGEPLELKVDGKTYFALVDLDAKEEPVSMLGEHWIIEGRPVECDVVPLEEEDSDNVGE